MYQSHTSPQSTSYRASAARENWKLSSSPVISSVARSRRDTIQRSSTASPTGAAGTSSTLRITKREAFQSLFARSLPCFTRFSE